MEKNKMEDALQSVRNAFSSGDKKIGVLYSGGKDSTVVLLTIAKEFPDAELSCISMH